MVRMRERLLRALAGLALALLLASFGGALHPMGDSLAVFRLGIAGVAFTLLWWARWPRGWTVVLALFCLGGAGSVAVHKLEPSPGGGLTLYQKNMFYHNADIAGLAADILASDADIVTLQEVSVENALLLEVLRETYPTQHLCRYSTRSGLAVLTRFEPAQADEGGQLCGRDLGVAGLRVAAPGGPLWVLSLHFTWPWPKPQHVQHAWLERLLAEVPGPRILAGDFNMVPWSHTLRRVARISGTQHAGPSHATLSLRGLPLPIDHVFAPGGGVAQARDWLGSDHRGIVAEISPIPEN